MKIIGITGASGAGKSEARKVFELYGIKSIDTDKISREVTAKNSECLKELAEYFSSDILTDNGELDRKKLAGIAFSSAENLKMLNKITHKHIINKCNEIITEMKNAGEKAVIIDAPLLFESGFNTRCDVIISVVSDLDKKIERIIKRDNITEEQAKIRIQNQKSDEFLRENSDFVIYNNSDYAKLISQGTKIHNILFGEKTDQSTPFSFSLPSCA